MPDSIAIGASTGSFFDICPTEVSLEKIKAIGFSFLEIYLQGDIELTDVYMKVLSERLLLVDMPVLSVHPVIARFEHFLYSDYLRQKEESLEKFKRYLCICSELKAKYFVMHMVSNGSENSLSTIVDKVNELAEIAYSYDVILGVENCPYGVLNNIENIQKYLPLLHDNIELILDFKSVWKVNEGLLQTLFAMSDRYCYSHLSSHNNKGLFGTNFTELNDDIRDLLHEINTNSKYSNRKNVLLETFWAKDEKVIERSFVTLVNYVENGIYR